MLINGKQVRDGSLAIAKLKNSGGQGTVTFGAGTMLAVTDAPTAATHVANKAYVDGLASGINFKAAVKAATTINLSTLEGTATLDGVSISAGDRVLVKNQTAEEDNGIYVVAAGNWARSADVNSAEELIGCFVFVDQGTANGNKGFVQTETIGTIGTDAVKFIQFTAQGSYTFGNGLTTSGQSVSANLGAGLEFSGSEITIDSSIAGSGLSINGSKVLSVDPIDLSTSKATGVLPPSKGGTGFSHTNVIENAILAGNGDGTGFDQVLITLEDGLTGDLSADNGEFLIGIDENGVTVRELAVTGTILTDKVIGWNGSALAWQANPNTDNQQLSITNLNNGSVKWDLTGDSASTATLDFAAVLSHLGINDIGDVEIAAPSSNHFLGYFEGSWINKRPTASNVSFSDTSTTISASDVQAAIEALDTTLGNISTGILDGADLEQSAQAAANNQYSGALISSVPKGYVMVYVNGLHTSLREDKTGACYFSGDSGATARTFANIASGDKVYWHGGNAGYNLESTDVIDLVYEI